jgi:hypothetical protein
MPLSIDLAAASRPLTDEEFGIWLRNQRIFLSSVMGELAAERAAIAEHLTSSGATVRWFEDFGGRDDDAGEAYLGEVRACTLYLGLLADQYGALLPTDPYRGYSATHAEYLEARKHGKRISFWQKKDDSGRLGHARDFLREVRVFHVTGTFDDDDDLPGKVDRRLRELAGDDLSPWVKVGDLIFRATRLRRSGDSLIVTARIYDPTLLAELESLAQQQSRRSQVQVTDGTHSGTGTVTQLETDSVSSAFTDVNLTLAVKWDGGRNDTAFSTEGFSAEQLLNISVRASLFGEPLPTQLQGNLMRGFVKVEDPLAEFAMLQLPEGSIGPIARLLVVEWLVGSRRAQSIERFDLGPLRDHTRRLELTYREPQVYTNRPAASHSVEGARHGGR